MKKTTIIGISLLLVAMAFTTAVTFELGTFSQDVHKDITDEITNEAIEKGMTTDELVGQEFIKNREIDFMNELFDKLDDKTKEVKRTRDIDKINKAIIELDDIINPKILEPIK